MLVDFRKSLMDKIAVIWFKANITPVLTSRLKFTDE